MSFGNWSGSGLKSPAPLQQQVQLFKASTLSVLLYGSASWVQTSDLCRQLDSFQMSYLRFMIEWEESPFPNQIRFLGHYLQPPQRDLISKYTLYHPTHGKPRPGGHKVLFHAAKLINPGNPPFPHKCEHWCRIAKPGMYGGQLLVPLGYPLKCLSQEERGKMKEILRPETSDELQLIT